MYVRASAVSGVTTTPRCRGSSPSNCWLGRKPPGRLQFHRAWARSWPLLSGPTFPPPRLPTSPFRCTQLDPGLPDTDVKKIVRIDKLFKTVPKQPPIMRLRPHKAWMTLFVIRTYINSSLWRFNVLISDSASVVTSASQCVDTTHFSIVVYPERRKKN